jgi:SAM-dependent methyltransferase
MIKQTTYHPDWQQNRINFILSKYPKDFFKGKRILELGAFNGYIGAYFAELGADVYSIEGRLENVDKIRIDYPKLNVQQADLDTAEWNFGHFDVIINFGLYYHLEKYHKEHLVNCINNCNLMFFETVIYDSFESEIFYRLESGNDQSLGTSGGNPSTSFVENIFKESGVQFTKYTTPFLNNYQHKYDWPDSNSKHFNQFHRRFWIVNK